MTTTTCYRVQPVGLGLDHQSETSEGEAAPGLHVFCTVGEIAGILSWVNQDWQPEVVEIACKDSDLRDNGDYEGHLLPAGRGEIVRRVQFADWSALREWAREYPETL